MNISMQREWHGLIVRAAAMQLSATCQILNPALQPILPSCQSDDKIYAVCYCYAHFLDEKTEASEGSW